MRAEKSRFLVIISGAAFAVLILACLGLKCNVNGNRPANLPPSVSFANIPNEGTTFTNQPLVHWFGKDLDGYVAQYQYVVFKASQIQLLDYDADSILGVEPGFIAFLKSIPPDQWEDSLTKIGKTLASMGEEIVKPVKLVTQSGSGQTQDRITLFASKNPADVILQFLFLRAVDNANAVSDVKNRKFFRTNNPPNTKIDFNNLEVYYSLSDSTRTWKGINIAWGGTDSIDYPTGDAPLEFFWELFYLGANSADTLNPDTTNPVAVSFDPDDGDKWVTTKTTVLPTGLITGYYMFRVRSRDDAFIPDPTPARSIFYVVKPTFEKNVLLVDITTPFSGQTGVVVDPFIYRPVYLNILAAAGYPLNPEDIVVNSSAIAFPSDQLLSRYKLVIVVNQDKYSGVSDSLGKHLIKYLNVGGEVWITGVYDFTTNGTFTEEKGARGVKRFPDELTRAFSVGELGYNSTLGGDYCGLEGYFMPAWEDLADSNKCIGGTDCAPNYQNWPVFPEGRNEEFIGASSLLPSPWPSILELDTANVKLASTYDADKKILLSDKLPRISYAVISSIHPRFPDLAPAEAIYLVNSAYGPSPVTMHGKPAIVRYQGPTFRTAVCTFPLFYIKMDQSVELTQQLIEWFMSPMPVS